MHLKRDTHMDGHFQSKGSNLVLPASIVLNFRFTLAHGASSYLPTLVEIGPALAEKKAFEIERTDARTGTQSVFIV